jgi:hypothetical protein
MIKSKFNKIEGQEIKENSSYSFLNICDYIDTDMCFLDDHFDFVSDCHKAIASDEVEVLSMRPNPYVEDKKISSITIRIRGE